MISELGRVKKREHHSNMVLYPNVPSVPLQVWMHDISLSDACYAFTPLSLVHRPRCINPALS